MNLKHEFTREYGRWSASTVYQNFERLIVYVLTGVIAVVVAMATWRLVLTVIVLVMTDNVDPGQYEVFQGVFGAIFTVLIALEFRHSMWVTLHSEKSLVQVRSVVLIALLALVRKFIILDVKTGSPLMIGAIAASVVSLGLVYWLIRVEDSGESSPDD
jgi:uncharacterized membrane protein (DUF373 family)